MIEKDLDTRFQEAIEIADTIPQASLPQDVQLRLYAYYKQATSGTIVSPNQMLNFDLRNALKPMLGCKLAILVLMKLKNCISKTYSKFIIQENNDLMKKIVLFSFFLILLSCNNKKLTEVVEVPLPAAEEKLTIGNPDDVKADEGTFELKKLPYPYDALIPHIDAATMEIHYSKHYLAYTNNLNKTLASEEEVDLTIEEILAKLDVKNTALRNNAGGYYNHNLYWENITPKGGGQPKIH